jgi:hypothetical protein
MSPVLLYEVHYLSLRTIVRLNEDNTRDEVNESEVLWIRIGMDGIL